MMMHYSNLDHNKKIDLSNGNALSIREFKTNLSLFKDEISFIGLPPVWAK